MRIDKVERDRSVVFGVRKEVSMRNSVLVLLVGVMAFPSLAWAEPEESHLILWEKATSDSYAVKIETTEDVNGNLWLVDNTEFVENYGDPNFYVGIVGDLDGDRQSEFGLFGKVGGLDGNLYYRDFVVGSEGWELGSMLYSSGNFGDFYNYIPMMGNIDGNDGDEFVIYGRDTVPGLNGDIYYKYMVPDGDGGVVFDSNGIHSLGNLGDPLNYELHFGDINGDGRDEAILWGTDVIPSLNGDVYFRYIIPNGAGGFQLDMSALYSLGNFGDPCNYAGFFHDMDADGRDEFVLYQRTADFILWKKILDDGFGGLMFGEMNSMYTSNVFTGDFGNPDEFIPFMAYLNVCDNPLKMDTNSDCQIDAADLKNLASEWLSPYDLVNFADMASEWLTCGYADTGNCWQ